MKITTILLIVTFAISAFKDIAENGHGGPIQRFLKKKYPYYIVLFLFICASFTKEQYDGYQQDIRDGKIDSLKGGMLELNSIHRKGDSMALVKYDALHDDYKELRKAIKREGFRYDSNTGGLISIKVNMNQSQSLVNNFPSNSAEEPSNSATKNSHIPETIRKQKLAYWQGVLQKAKANVDNDNATLSNVKEYHFLRMPSTRREEIRNASDQLEKDKSWAQQCADSVKYYQN